MGNTLRLSTEQLVSAYNSGTSAYRLAKDNECSIWSIITRLRKAGVEIRPDGVPKYLNLTPDRKQVFDSINGSIKHREPYEQIITPSITALFTE